MLVKPITDAVADLDGHCRVEEVGRTNLDGRSTSHQELNGIAGRNDAAQAHNGNADGSGYLPHHAQGHRLHSRAAQTASVDAEQGFAALDGRDGGIFASLVKK